MPLQVYAGSGRGNIYVANHMYYLEYRTLRSFDFTPQRSSPFERVPEPQSSKLIERPLAYATQDKYVLNVEWQDEGDLAV